MATIGQPLTDPEAGWARYDDAHRAILWDSGWYTGSNAALHGGAHKYFSNLPGKKVRFGFTGTKLRLISSTNTTYCNDITVSIDGGSPETCSQYSGSLVLKVLFYEKVGLSEGFHTVTITSGSSNINTTLDAVDIDSTGKLLTWWGGKAVTNVNDLEIGDIIPCEYVAATSGAVGKFDNLGTATKVDIPFEGSATRN